MSHDIDAIYDQGVFRPLQSIILPDGAKVHLHVEDENGADEVPPPTGRIYSPRLAHPEQAAEFKMEVREVPDAGICLQ